MQEQINRISTIVEEMRVALLGSSMTKKGGLVSRLDILEEKVDKMEKDYTKMALYQKLLYTAVGFVSMGVFTEILKRIFKQ